MDLARFRCRAPTVFPWRDTLIGLRPVPHGVLEEIYSHADAVWRSVGAPIGRGPMIERMIGIIAVAACEIAAPWGARFSLEDLREFSLYELSDLFQSWISVQESDTPNIDQMLAVIELQYAQGGSCVTDGAIAGTSTLDQFYGLPAAKLSVGQISYYRCLRAIESKQRATSGERCVSLSALEKRANKAQP